MKPAEVLAPSNDFVKDNVPSARAKAGIVFVEGTMMVEEALRGAWKCEALVIVPSAIGEEDKSLRARASERRVKVIEVAPRAMEKLSTVVSPPPCGVFLRVPREASVDFGKLSARLLVLDGISDPGNAGTLVRAAAAFGFSVALTAGSVSLANEKFLRASSGLAFRAGQVMRFPPGIESQKNLAGVARVLVLDARGAMVIREAVSSDQADRLALIVGNEAHGVAADAWPGARRVRIPMSKDVESLNAAVGGAIAMYEVASA